MQFHSPWDVFQQIRRANFHSPPKIWREIHWSIRCVRCENALIFVKNFLSYFHSSDCRHNIIIIWNDTIKSIISVHLMVQVLSSIYGRLRLFITNLSPSLIHRSLNSNKVSLRKEPHYLLTSLLVHWFCREKKSMQVQRCMPSENRRLALQKVCRYW